MCINSMLSVLGYADGHQPAVSYSDDDDDKDDGLWSDTEFEEFDMEQVHRSFMYTPVLSANPASCWSSYRHDNV